MTRRVHVLGAGVIGLTTAVELLTRGYAVTVTARDLPPHTTSDQAAAIWYPFIVEPRARVRTWADATRVRYMALMAEPAAGVSLIDLTVFAPAALWWVEELPPSQWMCLDDEDLPLGDAMAYCVRTLLIETPLFMPYLMAQVQALGAMVRQEEVDDLATAARGFDLVVNCTGLGARRLADDDRVHAVAGHILPFAARGGLSFVMDEAVDELGTVCYILPRRDVVVVGGSEVVDADRRVRLNLVSRIRRRALALAPQLAGLDQHQPYVGLRPGRDEVRLERTVLPDGKPVIHNYGHGGGGFTLCWGCAQDVGKACAAAHA